MVHQPHQQQAAATADDDAQDKLLSQQLRQWQPGEFGLALDQIDDDDDQQNGHGIVGAGFQLQGAADALVQADAGITQQVEHRRGVGGADDGAEQEPEQRVDIEQPGGEQADGGGGQHHP